MTNVFVLDWDNIALNEAIKRIVFIMNHKAIESIYLYESSTQKGYHISIKTYWYINPTFIFYLRRIWKDDGNRLIEDIFNKKAIFRDVAFEYKIIKGVKCSRTTMFKFNRIKYLSKKWQVKNQKLKSFQIYIQEQSELFPLLQV